MSKKLPTLGAALTSKNLDEHLDWLFAEQRDLELDDFVTTSVLDGANLTQHVQTIKSKLAGYTGRMGIHGPHWNIDVAAFDPKCRKFVQDRYAQALDICAELGATHMVVHSPLKFLGETSSFSNPQIGDWNDKRSLFEVIHETLAPVVRRAEEIGCILVIENIYDRSPEMLTRLVRSFDSNCVRQSLDVGHAYIGFVRGAPPPDYYVREAGDILAHVHLSDTDGYADRHWIPGAGNVNWNELFAAIGELSQQPRLLLELYSQAGIPNAFKWLTTAGLVR